MEAKLEVQNQIRRELAAMRTGSPEEIAHARMVSGAVTELEHDPRKFTAMPHDILLLVQRYHNDAAYREEIIRLTCAEECRNLDLGVLMQFVSMQYER